MLRYMPKNTQYLTSLSHPADQLLSSYTHLSARSCPNMTITKFFSSPSKEASAKNCSLHSASWLINGQLFDLGLNTSELSSSSHVDNRAVRKKIEQLDKKFSMVIILERLEESLIVMRDLLNWTTEDIIYIKSSISSPAAGVVPSYSDQQRSLAGQLNWADMLLYAHFSKKLDDIVNSNTAYYKQEVKNLRKRISLWTTRCIRDVSKMSSTSTDTYNDHMLTTRGKSIDKCIQLAMGELTKNNLLIARKPINSRTIVGGGRNLP